MTRSAVLCACYTTLAVLAGCGSEDPVMPQPSIEDLVGDWNATALVITSVADPSDSFDAIELGATLFLNVQASGTYTSGLSFQGAGTADVGTLEVDGSQLIFHVEQSFTGPRVDTADFQLSGDRLEITGPTIFDFDGDGINENATLDATLEREVDS